MHEIPEMPTGLTGDGVEVNQFSIGSVISWLLCVLDFSTRNFFSS